MFVVLDTNHFRELQEDSPAGQRLVAILEKNQAETFTCVVTIEETLQGWLAAIRRRPPGREQVPLYARLQRDVIALTNLVILSFDEEAAAIFHKLRKARPRAGTMDLKIASICLAHDVTLLTRNMADFASIEGLHVENWLD